MRKDIRKWIYQMNVLERDKIRLWDDIIHQKLASPEQFYELEEWLVRCCDLGYAEIDDVTEYVNKYAFNKKFLYLRMKKDSLHIANCLVPVDWILDQTMKSLVIWKKNYKIENSEVLYRKAVEERVLFEIASQKDVGGIRNVEAK